jgi:hypothetical protein
MCKIIVNHIIPCIKEEILDLNLMYDRLDLLVSIQSEDSSIHESLQNHSADEEYSETLV